MTTFFPKETLEEIRSRANIVGIISDYVSLKKAGRNYQGLCPFHNEKTPSFTVSEEKQVFYCFGCQKGGDVITFIKEINNLSFPEAVYHLAQRYGVTVPAPDDSQGRRPADTEALLSVNEKALAYFHAILMKRAEGHVGREYLKKRRISREVCETFSLGYAADRWDGLVSFLAKEKVSLEAAKSVGLISSRKEGGYFDYFRKRIIFPIRNLYGRPIGFGGRVISGGTPKYLNSPDSSIYKKTYSLFGLPITREAITTEDRVLIVEGYFDLLSLYQAGIRSVASPLGTALTSGHIRALKRYTTNMYVLFDADEAGKKATLRSLELFLEEGLSPRVVIMPAGHDPDEVINQKGPEYFQQQISQAPFLIDYFIGKTIARNDITHPDGKSAVIKGVMPILNQIGDPIVQDDYIRRLAEKLSVREDRIRRFAKETSVLTQQQALVYPEEDRREAFLLALVLKKPDLLDALEQANVLQDLDNADLRALGNIVLREYKEHGEVEIKRFIDGLDGKQRNLITALSLKEEHFGDSNESFKDCIRQIKRRTIMKMRMQLTEQIKKAQAEHNESALRDLNRQKALLLMQEKDLNSSIGFLDNL